MGMVLWLAAAVGPWLLAMFCRCTCGTERWHVRVVSSKWRRWPVIEMMTGWVRAHRLWTQGVGGHVGAERRSRATWLHVRLLGGHHVAVEKVRCHGQLVVRAMHRGPVVSMHHRSSMMVVVSIHGQYAVRWPEVRVVEVRVGVWWEMRWWRNRRLVLLKGVIASSGRTRSCV